MHKIQQTVKIKINLVLMTTFWKIVISYNEDNQLNQLEV